MISGALERRASTLANPSESLIDALGARSSNTGVKVTKDKALEWPAISMGIRLLSGVIASLPLNVFRRLDRGKEPTPSHPVYRPLHDVANPEQTAFEMREMMVAHIPLFGVAYAEKVRDNRGQLRHLWPINPDRVRPKRRSNGDLFYRITLPSRSGRSRQVIELPEDKVLRIPGFATDGLIGKSLVNLHSEAIGLGIATEEYAARFFSNGANPTGILEHPSQLSEEAGKRLRSNVEAILSGLDNQHRIALLEEGMQWQQVSTDPEKSQLVAGRQFQLNEAARILGLPPHLIGDLDRATFSNIEQQFIEFLTIHLTPWLRRLEGRYNMELFREQEQDTFFAEHVVEGLLRGDSQARAQFYNTLSQIGAITPNEIREKENMNPVDGGDEPFVQLNMVPLSQAKTLSPEQRTELLSDGQREDLEEYEEGVEARVVDQGNIEGHVSQRRRMLLAFRDDVFVDAGDRMVRGERRNIESALNRIDDEAGLEEITRAIERYYQEEHPDFARTIFGPVFDGLGNAAADLAREIVDGQVTEDEVRAFLDDYTEEFGVRYSASSRRELQGVAGDADEPQGAVRERLEAWEEGGDGVRPRAERIAERETHRLDNAVSRSVFAAAGVAMMWRTIGDSCPLCRRMSGSIVNKSEAFIQKGQTVDPDDDQTSPLEASRNITHPPLHDGCDCLVLPGIAQ